MMSESTGVWVFIEQDDGVIANVSLELLGAGRALADKLNAPLAGVLLGDGVKPLVQECFEFGADEVYLIDSPVLKNYRTEPYMNGIGNLCRAYQPEVFLFGATPNGKDIASAIATDVGTGLTADTTMLDIDEEKRLLEASRPAFGGNIMATILCKKHRPQMATVRPKVMKALPREKGRSGKLIEETLAMKEEDVRTKVLEIVREAGEAASLADAHIIVAGGKGMQDEKGFALLNELADVLGASVGGTRDVVEAGWLEHHLQIGQTGETVTPKLYFAIGISGAVQHVVGMKNSDMIIAINKDADAAIFNVCHYGIVGDALEIVPLLTDAFKQALTRNEVSAHV
ncbi:electron transfer flavoprotein subunit alpha/FixB family protein [Bacillus tianshenii]|nr:electron transfer flavoprotein subunit alpha/FixB family protein [Bacillus tianshenii]